MNLNLLFSIVILAFWHTSYGQNGDLILPTQDTTVNGFSCTFTSIGLYQNIDSFQFPSEYDTSRWQVYHVRPSNFISWNDSINNLYEGVDYAVFPNEKSVLAIFDKNKNKNFADDQFYTLHKKDSTPFVLVFSPETDTLLPVLKIPTTLAALDSNIIFRVTTNRKVSIDINGKAFLFVVRPYVWPKIRAYYPNYDVKKAYVEKPLTPNDPFIVNGKTIVFQKYNYETQEITVEVRDSSIRTQGYEKGCFWPQQIDSLLLLNDPLISRLLSRKRVYFYAAPWCGSCNEELPQIRALEVKLNAMGIEMITIVEPQKQ